MHYLRTAEHGRSVLDGLGSVLVLAPHPDDEALACASVLSKAARAGLPCRVVILTLGEAHEAAYTVLTARRALARLEPGVQGAAVRVLLGSLKQPEMRVIVALAGYAAADAEARLGSLPSPGCSPGEWKPVSSLGWVALPCPLGILVPEVEVKVRSRCYVLRASRLVGKEDRLFLGQARLRESCAALKKLGVTTLPFFAELGDGKAAEWWDWDAGRPAGRGIAVFEDILTMGTALPEPVGLFAPSAYDRDIDHKGIAAMSGLLAERLASSGNSVVVFRYLIHHPEGDDIWYMNGDPPGLPPFDVIETNDVVQKRSVLKCYASQLRVDVEGRLLKYARESEMFWRDTP